MPFICQRNWVNLFYKNSPIPVLTDCFLLASLNTSLCPRIVCKQVVKSRVLTRFMVVQSAFRLHHIRRNMMSAISIFSDVKLTGGSRYRQPDISIIQVPMNLPFNGFHTHRCPWPRSMNSIGIRKWSFSNYVIPSAFISCALSTKKVIPISATRLPWHTGYSEKAGKDSFLLFNSLSGVGLLATSKGDHQFVLKLPLYERCDFYIFDVFQSFMSIVLVFKLTQLWPERGPLQVSFCILLPWPRSLWWRLWFQA